MSLKPIRDSYVGEKRNHLRDGYGVYKYENKYFKYEGQWHCGKKHGHGKLLMKDGSFYEGEFKDGEIRGHGFKYWSVTKNTYSGQFCMGELEGHGVMRYADSTVYEGQWKNNKREGQGKLTNPDGSCYEGEFHNHKTHGDGKLTSSNGSVYEGGFIAGKRHGHGVLKMADGTVFDGQWQNDLFNGEGMMIHSSGVVYEGKWINGKPAKLATKMEFVEIDPEAGITVAQDMSFEISVRMVDDDGEIIEDNGREIKVTAGYKYAPPSQAKEHSSLFEALEDAEQNVIETPMGYTMMPYPISDRFVEPGLTAENTEISISTKGEQVEEQAAEEEVGEEEDPEAKSPTLDDEESVRVSAQVSPVICKSQCGLCEFSSLHLLPPPPFYRPFQLDSEKSNLKKQQQKKPKPSGKKRGPLAIVKAKDIVKFDDDVADCDSSEENNVVPQESSEGKSKSSLSGADLETLPRPGTYVIMVEDVTTPAFMSERLSTLFTTVTVQKMKRQTTATSVKDKGPNNATSLTSKRSRFPFLKGKTKYGTPASI